MRAVTVPTRGVARKRLTGQSCQETTHTCSDAVKGDSRSSLTRPQNGTPRLRAVRTTVPPERAQRCLRGSGKKLLCCRSRLRSQLSRSGKNHSAAGEGLGVNLVGVVRTTVLPEKA